MVTECHCDERESFFLRDRFAGNLVCGCYLSHGYCCRAMRAAGTSGPDAHVKISRSMRLDVRSHRRSFIGNRSHARCVRIYVNYDRLCGEIEWLNLGVQSSALGVRLSFQDSVAGITAPR
jgi:hypothetical protein